MPAPALQIRRRSAQCIRVPVKTELPLVGASAELFCARLANRSFAAAPPWVPRKVLPRRILSGLCGYAQFSSSGLQMHLYEKAVIRFLVGGCCRRTQHHNLIVGYIFIDSSKFWEAQNKIDGSGPRQHLRLIVVLERIL
jgi:hypothetical protein